ncbi:hypothetical protein EDB89DRAFT_1974095 [Lactarius sanguifluus]|nr:hypothetical protein EDB89DRAFT_1974095 [Lactarius sanguifluus]
MVSTPGADSHSSLAQPHSVFAPSMSKWGPRLMVRGNQNLGDLSFPVVGWQRRSLRAMQSFFALSAVPLPFRPSKLLATGSIELADPGRDVTRTTADRREHCLGNLLFNAGCTKYDTARPRSSCSTPLPPTALTTADQQSKSCATIAVLYYDHVLTFPAEVSHVWSQPISVNMLLFLLNRYVAFLGNVAVPLIGFSGLISLTVRRQSTHELHSRLILSLLQSCTSATYVRQGLLVLSQVLVSMTLAIRIIALYHSTRRIILWVVGCGTVLAWCHLRESSFPTSATHDPLSTSVSGPWLVSTPLLYLMHRAANYLISETTGIRKFLTFPGGTNTRKKNGCTQILLLHGKHKPSSMRWSSP